jgi:hypothetical protein
MSRRVWIVAGVAAVAYVALAALWVAQQSVSESVALACAKHSAGTDSDIAACYTSRGLPVPEDI